MHVVIAKSADKCLEVRVVTAVGGTSLSCVVRSSAVSAGGDARFQMESEEELLERMALL
jgi:hypothetical protein